MYYWEMSSPVGKLLLAGDEIALRMLNFQDGTHPMQPPPAWRRNRKPFKKVLKQLNAYFSGKRLAFDLSLAPEGTPFQLKVWRTLCTIPYGETCSYGQLARRIRQPTAFRAVGAANGKNPIPIIVPCHRVIGASGTLTGFGGGLGIKRLLLQIEGCELS